MKASFDLDHEQLARSPQFSSLANSLRAEARIDSPDAFNRYCRTACRSWSGKSGSSTSARFDDLLERIARHEKNTIPTSWGGVVITRHEHLQVEKYLVVRKGGYLALEKHEQKDEHLEVQEGAGLVLFRKKSATALTVQALSPGNQFHFAPGQEHCLIGTDNLLVFEKSTDPKGMDQDLIFIYEPDGRGIDE